MGSDEGAQCLFLSKGVSPHPDYRSRIEKPTNGPPGTVPVVPAVTSTTTSAERVPRLTVLSSLGHPCSAPHHRDPAYLEWRSSRRFCREVLEKNYGSSVATDGDGVNSGKELRVHGVGPRGRCGRRSNARPRLVGTTPHPPHKLDPR